MFTLVSSQYLQWLGKQSRLSHLQSSGGHHDDDDDGSGHDDGGDRGNHDIRASRGGQACRKTLYCTKFSSEITPFCKRWTMIKKEFKKIIKFSVPPHQNLHYYLFLTLPSLHQPQTMRQFQLLLINPYLLTLLHFYFIWF